MFNWLIVTPGITSDELTVLPRPTTTSLDKTTIGLFLKFTISSFPSERDGL